MKKLLLAIMFTGVLLSCETEITDFKTKNLSTAVVVYGELTNLTGPYSVRLNYTSAYSPYDVTEFQGKPVSGAEVKIEDSAGNVFMLYEVQSGHYQSGTTFKGQVAQKYRLKIKTKDGLEIESDFAELKEPVELDEFSYKFISAEKVADMKFEVKATLKDPAETEDYYFIKKQDFIEFLTTCPPPPPSPSSVPVCYSRCWRAPLNTQPILLKDFLVNGRKIPVEIANIPYTDFTDWIVQLDVFSVSKTIFDYWQRQEEQRVLGGSIFDKVPAQIIGNMRCINKPGQEVLGAFVVAGLNKKRLEVDRFEGAPSDAYQKLIFYVGDRKIRFQDFPIWDCRQAGFVDYNIGFNIPPLFP